MLLNERGHRRAIGGQGANGAFLIFAHEAAVAFDIGAEDGSEFAFHIHPAGDYPASRPHASSRAGDLVFKQEVGLTALTLPSVQEISHNETS